MSVGEEFGGGILLKLTERKSPRGICAMVPWKSVAYEYLIDLIWKSFHILET
jgi:hypothetical protein